MRDKKVSFETAPGSSSSSSEEKFDDGYYEELPPPEFTKLRLQDEVPEDVDVEWLYLCGYYYYRWLSPDERKAKAHSLKVLAWLDEFDAKYGLEGKLAKMGYGEWVFEKFPRKVLWQWALQHEEDAYLVDMDKKKNKQVAVTAKGTRAARRAATSAMRDLLARTPQRMFAAQVKKLLKTDDDVPKPDMDDFKTPREFEAWMLGLSLPEGDDRPHYEDFSEAEFRWFMDGLSRASNGVGAV